MSCAKSRTIFGSTSYSMPSRFLTEVPVSLLDGEIKKKENRNEYRLEDEDSYNEFGYGYSGNRNSSYGFNEGRVAYGIPVSASKIENAFSFKSAESFLQKLKADDTVNLEDFKVGKLVEHKKFGQGTIIGVEPEDDDLKVEIQFEKAGMKRLMAKFAGIKIL